jgi:hypothetical protein
MGAQLSHDQKQERVRICSDIIAAIHHQPKSILDCIVTVDEIVTSYHASETKQKQNKQWILKGQPGPLKGRSTPTSPAPLSMAPTVHHPGQFHGLLQEEEAHHGPATVVVPLGQCSSP